MQRLKLTRDEGRLLVVHTGRQVNGQNRYGIAIINTRTNKLTPFKTTLWEDNLQFVGGIQRIYGGDISPDGTQFVVSSGSGGDRPPINDTVIVYNLNNDSDAQPVWISRHFDSRVLGHLDRGRASTSAATSSGPRTPARRSRGRASTTSGTAPARDSRRTPWATWWSSGSTSPRSTRRTVTRSSGSRRPTPTRATSTSRRRRAACSSAVTATPRAASTSAGSRSSTSRASPANNTTQTVITDPIEGRIKPVDESFEITGTATAPSGVNRVELEIMDRNTGRYLADDLTTWGSTTLNTFNATLDPGTGPNRTWRLPITISGNRELQVRARAVACNGTADNTKAAKKFETFGNSDVPPDTSISGPGSPVNSLTFTITGTATDDVGRQRRELHHARHPGPLPAGRRHRLRDLQHLPGGAGRRRRPQHDLVLRDHRPVRGRVVGPGALDRHRRPVRPSTPTTGAGSSPRTASRRRCRSPSRR